MFGLLPAVRLSGSRLGSLQHAGRGIVGRGGYTRDARLHRTVAVKVLPAHLAKNPEFRARFDREARAIGALGHPNICVLHDVGHHDGTDFLVMEYLEGETLADRLKKGPLPLDQVLRYAIDIADALHTAHHAGIVHRDLKPSNIMLVRRGGSGAPVSPMFCQRAPGSFCRQVSMRWTSSSGAVVCDRSRVAGPRIAAMTLAWRLCGHAGRPTISRERRGGSCLSDSHHRQLGRGAA